MVRSYRRPRRCLPFPLPSAVVAVLALPNLSLPAEAQTPSGGHDAGEHAEAARAGHEPPPLYDDLGRHGFPVTTTTSAAQAYFDQGLRLYYGFNHAEAIRSFREAQRRDANCAMCFWGEALAWGPNINLPMDSAAGVAAWEAIQQAHARRAGTSEKERALIDALARRYAEVPPAGRARLDSSWARGIGHLAHRWPDDLELTVLAGEAQMTLRPWNYWTEEGEPQPGIREAIQGFERALASNPDHPGACHFFIHAVEELYPERAVPCAERLAGLMPGAGHVVHMPGHIYIRVGRYLDAIRANEHAVHADETYIRDQRPGPTIYTAGYYPHNYDFLAFAASMVGRRSQTVEAADRLAALVPADMLGAPGFTFLQNHITRPLQMRVRFSLWDEVLATASPAEGLHHARGMWHYARGRAFAATGRLREAEGELERLDAVRATLDGERLEFNAASDILAIARGVLAGHLAAARGDHDAAVQHLEEAVRLEEALLYGEPPEWSVPVRHDLAPVLLEAGRHREAEGVARAALEHFPDNVWSLEHLALALEARGEAVEAAQVRARLERIREAAAG